MLQRIFSPFFLLTAVFRECGGARCSHNLVPYIQCRQHALAIVQQLVLSRDGEDDMGTLLGLMNSTPPNQLQLKTDILQVFYQFFCPFHTHTLLIC